MKNHPLLRYNPKTLAHFEKENYVAYYQKDWPKLLQASVGMVKEAFALNLLQAIYGASLIARAEIAFAPFPDNDLPKAAAYLIRFFQFIKGVHHLDIDVDQATRAELTWWIAHRRCFGSQDNQELVNALVEAYTVEYGASPEQVYPGALHRAKGMLFSDLWVNGGKEPTSSLLKQEEEELERGYQLLQEALK